jgi:hypothetical protein
VGRAGAVQEWRRVPARSHRSWLSATDLSCIARTATALVAHVVRADAAVSARYADTAHLAALFAWDAMIRRQGSRLTSEALLPVGLRAVCGARVVLVDPDQPNSFTAIEDNCVAFGDVDHVAPSIRGRAGSKG